MPVCSAVHISILPQAAGLITLDCTRQTADHKSYIFGKFKSTGVPGNFVKININIKSWRFLLTNKIFD